MIKFELLTKKCAGYLVTLVVCFSVAYLENKVIPFITILIAYTLTRYMYPKTFHCNTDNACIFASIATFTATVCISLPITISLLSGAILGSMISFVLYCIAPAESMLCKCVKLGYSEKKTKEIDYIELAKDWINDKDIGSGKTLKYYYFIVV